MAIPLARDLPVGTYAGLINLQSENAAGETIALTVEVRPRMTSVPLALDWNLVSFERQPAVPALQRGDAAVASQIWWCSAMTVVG